MSRKQLRSNLAVFEVFSFGSDAGPQPWPPLLYGLIDDALFQLRPDCDEALLESYATAIRGHFFPALIRELLNQSTTAVMFQQCQILNQNFVFCCENHVVIVCLQTINFRRWYPSNH